jgi:hypothetical protein
MLRKTKLMMITGELWCIRATLNTFVRLCTTVRNLREKCPRLVRQMSASRKTNVSASRKTIVLTRACNLRVM